MSPSELSVTLSISQLLQFQICAALDNGQPTLQLDTAPQPFAAALLPDLPSIDIKFETQYINGRSVLRIFAIQKSDRAIVKASSPFEISLLDSSPYVGSTNGSPFDVGSSAPSPSSYPPSEMVSSPEMSLDFFTRSSLMNNYDSFLSPFAMDVSTHALSEPHYSQMSKNQHQILPNDVASHPLSDLNTAKTSPDEVAPWSPSNASLSSADTPASSTSAEEDASGPRRRPRRFNCLDTSCTRMFASKYTLKLHMTTHQQSHKIRYKCEMGCPETFSRQHDRLRHEVARHGRISQWTCNRCKHLFSSQTTHNRHSCPDIVTVDKLRS